MRYLVAIVVLLSLADVEWAAQQTPAKHESAPSHSASPKPKFSPHQMQALKILIRAETHARSLPPPDRTSLLYQIAVAYGSISPAKRRQLEIAAFEASVAMDDAKDQPAEQLGAWGLKNYFQDKILRQLFDDSPADMERVLPRAVPKLRREYTAHLAGEYAQRKQFGRALQLLHAAAGQGEFPYSAAATMLLYLPPEKASERLNIFTEALNAYSQSPESFQIRFEDLATLVIRFWQDLPVPLVTEAIDTILSHAKDAADNHPVQMRVRSSNGDASFGSEYDLRLFQLLPVLEQMDRSRAVSLLRENSSVQNLLQRYPAGMRSLDTGLTNKPRQNGQHSRIYTIELHSGEGPTDFGPPVEPDRHGQLDVILELAGRDPKQALQRALNFQAPPETRAQTFVILAEIAAQQNRSIAEDALVEARKLFSADLDPRFLDEELKKAAEVYLKLGDQDSALNMIAAGLKLAEQQYAKDSDKSDPNQAPKGQWPSTGIYRQFIGLVAGKISLSLALKMVDEISDPDLRPHLQVGLASSLLGIDPEVRQAIHYSASGGISEIW